MTTIKRGDVIQLGQHRLMCGDCTHHDDVEKLFGIESASTIIFSPPYEQRRVYDAGLTMHGTSLFLGAISSPPVVLDHQIFAVVGNLHHNGEQMTFYEHWIAAAQSLGYRRFSTYIWDKQHGLPGSWAGRLAPVFEWIFHLNKKARDPAKHRSTIWGKGAHVRKNKYSSGNTIHDKRKRTVIVSDLKIDDSIIRVNPAGKCSGIGHPAVFPVDLPYALLMSYGAKGGVAYDPMCGSGSTILAAHRLGLVGYGMELSPKYCQIAVDRIKKEMAISAGSA